MLALLGQPGTAQSECPITKCLGVHAINFIIIARKLKNRNCYINHDSIAMQ